MSFGPPRKRNPDDDIPLRITVQQGFDFELDKRLKRKTHHDVLSDDFESETKEEPAQKKTKLKQTNPKSPNLQTTRRSRPVSVLSAAEIEEREVEEMKAYRFKAKPVAYHQMAQVKPIEHKPPTEMEAFHLSKSTRIAPLAEPAVEEIQPFKAAPFDLEKLRAQPILPPPSKPRQPTVPITPDLSFKKTRPRQIEWLQQQKELKEKEEAPKPFKAHSMPVYPEPLNPLSSEPSVTLFEPFDLKTEERGEIHDENWANKQKDDEEKARRDREFQARGMPIGSPQGPNLPPPKVTLQEPFNLESVTKHSRYVEDFNQKLEDQLEKEREDMLFKARDAPNPHFFEPRRSDASPTRQEPFKMEIDIRAEKRKEFDDLINEKAKMAEASKENRRMLDQEREKREIEAARKLTVHKPLPIMKRSVPFEVSRSEKKLTEPKTPNFASKTRAMRSKKQQEIEESYAW